MKYVKADKVIITGGAGLIGSELSKIFLNQGYDVYVFDAFIQYLLPFNNDKFNYLHKRFKGYLGNENLNFLRGDVRDRENLRKIINKIKPKYIIHLANLPLADLSNINTEEAISSIFNSTVNLLDIIKDDNTDIKLTYASSSMIYGDFKYIPCDESHPKEPKDIYGGTKFATETIIETYSRRFNLDYTIVRPSAVYGPNDINRRVSQIFIENAIKNKPIYLHNGGSSVLDFTYVEDIAYGLYLATIKEKASKQIYNITRGEGRTLREFVDILGKYFKKIKIEEKPADMFRPERGSLDINKAKKDLNYSPQFSLEDGIKKYLESIDEN